MSEWIEWAGGYPPVAANTRVEVQLRDGTVNRGEAGAYDWTFHHPYFDIVKYRVVETRSGHMADAMAYAFQAFDFAKPDKDIKTEIADEAKRIVTGARRSAYGSPEQNFERIARFWQAYFENTGRGDLKITAADVSPMMRLMKEARLCETPDHRDSFVDLVGYSLTGAEVNGVKPLDKSVG